MKKIILLFLFFIISYTAFSQSDELPAFMIEINAGYAIGINLNNTIPVNVKLIYSYERFGFVAEAGGLFSDSSFFHLFLGPMIYVINIPKWRIPIALGFDIFHGESLYYGIGSIFSAHYRLTNNLYVGLNIGITYAFNNVYEEFVEYRTITTIYNETTLTQTVPVYESKNHFGSSIYIKPSLSIGMQF